VGDKIHQPLGQHRKPGRNPAGRPKRAWSALLLSSAAIGAVIAAAAWMALSGARIETGNTVVMLDRPEAAATDNPADQTPDVQQAAEPGGRTDTSADTDGALPSLHGQSGADVATTLGENGEEINKITDGKGVEIVLDMVAGDYVARNLQCLKEDGRHVTIAVQGGLQATINMAQVMMKRLILTGSTLRPQSAARKALLGDELHRYVWPDVEAGKLKPVMDESFPLADAAKAHAHMEAGDHIGKIVLIVE